MKTRKLLMIVPLLVLGIAPVALLMSSGFGGREPFVPRAGGEWPYCLPDSPAPSFTPKFELPTEGTYFEPRGSGVVQVSEPVEASGAEGDRVVVAFHQAPIPLLADSFGAGGNVRLLVPSDLLAVVNGRVKEGVPVLLEVGPEQADGSYGSSWAVVPTTGEILAPTWSPAAVAPTQLFIEEQVEAGADVTVLVESWNHSTSDSGIRRAFFDFIGSGREGPAASIPKPGTVTWWTAAPAECRAYADAPPEVLKGLTSVNIRIAVPMDGFPTDAVICLRDEVAGMGCSAIDATDDGYVSLDAYATGRTTDVQVSLLVDGVPSWLNRKTIATIDAAQLEDPPIEGIQIDLVDELRADSFSTVDGS